MGKKWKIITLTGILALLSGTYFCGIPAIVNLPARQNIIEQKIFENTGIKVNLGNSKLSMGTFPSVWIKSDNISIINKDNSKALSIENPEVKLKLFPLIFKKIEIAEVSASNEIANFVLTKDKKLLLGDYPLQLKEKDNFKLEQINLDLGNYSINLDDKLNNQQIKLNGKYFHHVKFLNDENLSVETNGSFKVDGISTNYFADIDLHLPLNKLTNNKIKLNASIQDFDLSSISEYVNILSKGYFKDLHGKLNFASITKNGVIYSNLSTKNLELIGQDKPTSIVFPDKLNAKINFQSIYNGVKFKKVSVNGNNLHINADGYIKKSNKKIPAMDLNIEIKPSRGEQLVRLIPGFENLCQDIDFYKLKSYPIYGAGEGKLHFVGKGDRPEVFGHVNLNDVYLIKRIPNTSKGGDVNMDFTGKVMKLDVEVPTGNKGENVSVKGFVKIDGSKYSELKIKSKGDVMMEYAQEVINPLHEIFKFKMGPVPIMKLRGFGYVDVFSAGKKIDPHLFGTFKFKNATASFNQIHNLELNNASGIINFNNTEIPFKTLSGTINGKPTKIYGDCDVKGNLNVFAQTEGQEIPKILKVINTSENLAEVQKVIKPFTKANGVADLFLNIYGKANDVINVEFNKDIFAKGKIIFHNSTTVLQDTFLPLTNINGTVNFDKKNADYDVTGFARHSKIHVNGTAKDKSINLIAKSDKFRLRDIFDLAQPKMNMPYKNEIGELYASFTGGYKGNVESGKLDYNKITANGNLLSNENSNNPIKIFKGNFNIQNSILHGNNIKGLFNENPFTLSFIGSNIYKNMEISDASFNIDNFNLGSLNAVKKQIELSPELKAKLDSIIDIKGIVDINGQIKNGKLYTDTNLENISFIYKPADALIRILNGKANIRSNTLYLGNVNTSFSSMPLFINGKISDFEKNPNIDLYITGKPTQMFLDRVINNKSVYPVKIKGDVNFVSKIKGTLDKLYSNTSLNIGENSSIYYMGATLAGAPSGSIGNEGIATNPVSINMNTTLYPKQNKISIDSLKYTQGITSQNKKVSLQDQLTVSGDIKILKDNILSFNNLKIKTFEPTDARIFNIILKKPTIKQGLFTANLDINGTSISPKILGDLKITSVDIPLLDATIRDIALDFDKYFINLKSRGIVLTNDINLDAKIVNKIETPLIIEDLNILMDTLDLNIIAGKFNEFDTEKLKNTQSSNSTMNITPEQILIKKADINADKVIIKKAEASNFNANAHLGEDHILKVDNYSFNLANGLINGIITYNLTDMGLYGEMNIKDADAQIISENFFDMADHIFGKITGDLKVACVGKNSLQCINSLSGEGHFNVIDGSMPKLGSLEYLLKAANLITGGITGVSINGIIDLITPLKTGEFESIKGDIKIKNGIANDIEVFSSGKELNMYMKGNYNLMNLVADMEIYGSLSKDFSTLLGKLCNLSLNRLLNTIPGISINQITPDTTSNIHKIPNFDPSNVLRVFKAEIYGDINGSNYVKSFRWIKH
ncbi:hypothetical protein J6G99_00955 [bacterium]|nr:hypothetical protein [bacterium]